MPIPDATDKATGATSTHQVEPDLPSRGQPIFKSTERFDELALETTKDKVDFLVPTKKYDALSGTPATSAGNAAGSPQQSDSEPSFGNTLRRRLNDRPSGSRLMERLLREER